MPGVPRLSNTDRYRFATSHLVTVNHSIRISSEISNRQQDHRIGGPDGTKPVTCGIAPDGTTTDQLLRERDSGVTLEPGARRVVISTRDPCYAQTEIAIENAIAI